MSSKLCYLLTSSSTIPSSHSIKPQWSASWFVNMPCKFPLQSLALAIFLEYNFPSLDISMTWPSFNLSHKCHLLHKAFSRYQVFLLCLIMPIFLPTLVCSSAFSTLKFNFAYLFVLFYRIQHNLCYRRKALSFHSHWQISTVQTMSDWHIM